MNDLVMIDKESGIALLDSRVAARELGVEHKNLKELIRNHFTDVEKVPFQTAPSEAGQTETFYLLNERQSLQIITRVRNTEKSLIAKDKLIDAFLEMRDALSSIRETMKEVSSRIEEIRSSLYEQINWSYKRARTIEAEQMAQDTLKTIESDISAAEKNISIDQRGEIA